MNASDAILRRATVADLPKLNAVIDACVMGWDLPERVKRLSLNSYRYKPHDLDHLHLLLAQDASGQVLAVAAWEAAEAADLPRGQSGLLLHGLYVLPEQQRRGLGCLLLAQVFDQVRRQGLDGLLVKAQADAVGFFKRQGFVHLPIVDARRDYPHRHWKSAG